MTNQEKSSLINLISTGEVEVAIDKLLSMEINKSSKKEIIAVSSRFKKLKQQNRLGTISFEQSTLAENQIIAHLIDLINHPADKPFPGEKPISNLDIANFQKEKKSIGYKIGIVGSIASVIGLLLYFFPIGNTRAPQLTIYVTDAKGNVVLEHRGELNTSIGNRPMRETIGEHGRTNFGDILPEYLGDTISIGFKTEGWEIADGKNIFVFSGKPIRIKVKKDNSLGVIKGVVKTRDGQKIIEGARILINAETIVLTDTNGIFKVVLPESMRVKKIGAAYKLTISKEGYKTETQYFYTKSSDAEVRLKKIK